jgi:ubiquinone/menaquinone biosynthesis C-methylase UbiE
MPVKAANKTQETTRTENPLLVASFRYQRRFAAGGVLGKAVRRLPRRLLHQAKSAVLFPLDCADFILRRRHEMVPPRYLSFEGDGDFEATGDEFLGYFVELGNLRPEDRVLEVGCGIGRMARPLTHYLTSGTYEGIDIVPKGIRWCQSNISKRHNNFHFQVADVENAMYNPRGHFKACQYSFPFPDASFDFIYLVSVFTHMLKRDMSHYLSEIVRMLRPQGRCFSTFFLLNEESRKLVESGRSSLTFNVNQDGCWLDDEHLPEHAVAYEERQLRSEYDELGLVLKTIRYGGWSGRTQGLSYQDIVVSTKN